MDVFPAPPQAGQIWRETAIMEVGLQILACLPLLTLPKGCNNQPLVCAAASCEMTQQGTCPGSSLLGHMPMVGPQQKPQFLTVSPSRPGQVLPLSSHMATTMTGRHGEGKELQLLLQKWRRSQFQVLCTQTTTFSLFSSFPLLATTSGSKGLFQLLFC